MTITDYYDSPIGQLRFAVEDGRLLAMKPAWMWDGPDGEVIERDETGVADALDRYFAGDVMVLDDLDVAPDGTPFFRAAWEAMRGIKPGSTRSYAELAREVGAPRAVRAVGTACARNPIFLVVPCHRVLRSDGSLGGYGGGLDMKRWLLDHESMGRIGRPTSS